MLDARSLISDVVCRKVGEEKAVAKKGDMKLRWMCVRNGFYRERSVVVPTASLDGVFFLFLEYDNTGSMMVGALFPRRRDFCKACCTSIVVDFSSGRFRFRSRDRHYVLRL